MAATKINDTTAYPNTAPALTDHWPGTDVSDTGNDAGGETVTFTFQAAMDLFEANFAAPTSAITSGTFADARISESSVTQHEAALSVTESQISDFGTYGDAVTTNPLSQFAATTSAQLASVMSNESGSGLLVFNDSPTLVTPDLGTPSALNLTNATALPEAQVTAHEAALTITESQISDLGTYSTATGVENNADVTDATNVAAAGAVMTDGSADITGDLIFSEKADHTATPAAGKGQLWVKNTVPATIIFTDDAGTDVTLGAAGGGISNVVEDTTPQLGGDLDMNSNSITGDILPTTDSLYDIGSATFAFAEGHFDVIYSGGNAVTALADPAAQTVVGWNDTTNATVHKTGGNGITINATTIDADLDSADIGVTIQGYDADTLKADTADTLTAGFDSSDYAAGTKSSGTYTPAASDGNFQVATNGGAHTLAPPSTSCAIIIHYTNNGSAGTITTSGFTIVTGDSLTTTDTHEFIMHITKINDVSALHVTALQ